MEGMDGGKGKRGRPSFTVSAISAETGAIRRIIAPTSRHGRPDPRRARAGASQRTPPRVLKRPRPQRVRGWRALRATPIAGLWGVSKPNETRHLPKSLPPTPSGSHSRAGARSSSPKTTTKRKALHITDAPHRSQGGSNRADRRTNRPNWTSELAYLYSAQSRAGASGISEGVEEGRCRRGEPRGSGEDRGGARPADVQVPEPGLQPEVLPTTSAPSADGHRGRPWRESACPATGGRAPSILAEDIRRRARVGNHSRLNGVANDPRVPSSDDDHE